MTRQERRDGKPWIPPRSYGSAVTPAPERLDEEPLINLVRGAFRLAELGTTQRELLRVAVGHVERTDLNRKMAIEAVMTEIPAGTPDEPAVEHIANAIQLVGVARNPELANAVPGGLPSVLVALEARLRTADMRLSEEAGAAADRAEHNGAALDAIVDAIDHFDTKTTKAEHTDTGEAWELLNRIRDVLKAIR